MYIHITIYIIFIIANLLEQVFSTRDYQNSLGETNMIRLSYTLKCWMLGITYFLVFYFMVIMSDPSFSKYIYMLALSTLLFPIAKRAIDVAAESLVPNITLFNGLLSSLFINVIIWLCTPFIVALTVITFVFYSMGVMTERVRH